MEWDAKKYEKNSQMQFKIGMRAINLLNLQGSETVLDIGCGTGVLDLQIARKLDAGTILGVDSDASMISFARQAIERNDAMNFSVIQASATELDFQEEFDAVFSNIVIHWIANVQKLFRVLYAALKPGGRLVITTGYGDNSENLEKTMGGQIELSLLGKFITEGYSADILPAAELQAHIAKLGPLTMYPRGLKEFHRMLQKAGFQDIQLDTQLLWNEFGTLDAYMNSREAGSWWYFSTVFPAKYRNSVRLRLRELFRAEWEKIPVEQRECPIREKWPVVFIQAKKE